MAVVSKNYVLFLLCVDLCIVQYNFIVNVHHGKKKNRKERSNEGAKYANDESDRETK